MKNARKITAYFTLAILAIALIYDGAIMLMHGQNASISTMIIEWSYKYPMVTFLTGFTCGHLFWRMGDSKVTRAIAKARGMMNKAGDK